MNFHKQVQPRKGIYLTSKWSKLLLHKVRKKTRATIWWRKAVSTIIQTATHIHIDFIIDRLVFLKTHTHLRMVTIRSTTVIFIPGIIAFLATVTFTTPENLEVVRKYRIHVAISLHLIILWIIDTAFSSEIIKILSLLNF